MVSSDRKLANVVGGKTARACDNCVRKRARWYCAADDAFLCQSCDASVHSANPLARRHQRLRLSNSLKLHNLDKPKWHHGFTKKPRTPRFHHRPKSISPLIHLVPESDHIETSTSGYYEEEQLLYQVPVFDPFEAELCVSAEKQTINSSDDHLAGLNGGLPSDVETLLGKAGGIDEDLAGGGFLDCREKKLDDERVKVEDVNMMQQQSFDDEIINIMEIDQMMREHSPSCCLWEDHKLQQPPDNYNYNYNYNYMQLHMVKEDIIVQKYHDNDEIRKNKKLLKLDYDGIIAAWDDQRSPWTTGGRPEMDPDDCWAQCMLGGIMHQHPVAAMGMNYPAMAMLDGGREARVSRYREKRRTRLFSKKIRYEVRKLNAEKRPRMKGRFVKRSTTSSSP